MKDVISMRDFSKDEIVAILDFAQDIKKAIHGNDADKFKAKFRAKYGKDWDKLLEGKLVATLFTENSTRTYHSIRAAAMRAGAKVDGFPSDAYTSLQKGETWEATAKMFMNYGFDVIAMRTSTEGLPRWTVESLKNSYNHLSQLHSRIGLPLNYKLPFIINGGDGKNQHPSQCFLDLFTMREIARTEGKDLDGLEFALLNDLKYGRTNASLMSVAHLFNFKLHLAYPSRFGPSPHILEDLKRKNVQFIDYGQDFVEAMKNSYFAYHSRPQKERVGKGEDLISIKQLGQINKKIYEALGKYAPYLMHPLPVDAETFEEISSDMLNHPKNITDLQASNGLYVRIALMALGTGSIKLDVKLDTLHALNLDALYYKNQGLLVKNLAIRQQEKNLENPPSGFIEKDGLVLDHIPAGMARRLEGILGFEQEKILCVASYNIPSPSMKAKDMLKVHGKYNLSHKQLQAIALIAPEIAIAVVESGKVVEKYRPVIGDYVVNLVQCGNSACVTNVKKEHVIPRHNMEDGGILRCNYCEVADTVGKIYEDKRFIYITR